MNSSSKTFEKCRTALGLVLVYLSLTFPLYIDPPSLWQAWEQRDESVNQQHAARAQINTLKMALQQYKTLHQAFPTNEDNLAILVSSDPGAQKVAESPAIRDPWGHAYQYKSPATGKSSPSFEIWSMGPDGLNGTNDDIRGSKDELAIR